MLERRADFAEGRAEALGLTGPKSLEDEIAELKRRRQGRRRTGSHEGRAGGAEQVKKGAGDMAERYQYSMDRRDKKLAGVCSTLGEVFKIDPTFIRIGFVAVADDDQLEARADRLRRRRHLPAVQRKNAVANCIGDASDFERMDESARCARSVHELRTELDPPTAG